MEMKFNLVFSGTEMLFFGFVNATEYKKNHMLFKNVSRRLNKLWHLKKV